MFFDSIQNSILLITSRIHCSKSIPVHLPDMNKDVAPAYIEVGSGSFQVRSYQ